jgi:uncharacterized protein YaiL (DUF2058 family)
MSNSLKDQLLGLGFKQSPAPEKPKQAKQHRPNAATKPQQKTQQKMHEKRPAPSASADELDLAKAYAMRTQHEKQERERAEREKQEKARLRKEAKAKLEVFMKDQTTLNVQDAEKVRHFNYGGKIKRIYVTDEQLAALNRAELGVLQMGGRYLLVTAAVLAEAKQIFPESVALEVDLNAPEVEPIPEEADYNDPKFQIPDDLSW